MKTTKGMRVATVWKLCLEMWDWIVERILAGDERDVSELKLAWCKGHNFDLRAACFFCDYALRVSGERFLFEEACICCPGKAVSPRFDCQNEAYDWDYEPLRFHAKLHRMNKKRLKK